MRLGTYYRYLIIKKLELPIDGKCVLDIGGYDGFILSNTLAENKTLIDMNAYKRNKDISYIYDDFLKYDFNSQMFDRVFALDVLEHVKDDELFLQKLLKILSMEGMAILSIPCKKIEIFPSLFQSYIDKKWGHIYRRGYDEEDIRKIIGIGQQNFAITLYTWNCPLFRFFYLPLSLSWKISPGLTKIMLGHIVNIDSKFKDGVNGFLFMVIKKT